MYTKAEILETVNHSLDLALPQAANNVLLMINNPEQLDIEALAYEIEQVELLRKIVLQNANFPFYGIHRRLHDVKSVIQLLGIDAIRNFVVYYLNLHLIPQGLKNTPYFDLQNYWEHVLATSLACLNLSTSTDLAYTYRLFSYGLIHDIGIVALVTVLPKSLPAILDLIHTGVPQLEAERQIMDGLTHCDIGSILAQRWGAFQRQTTYY